VLIADARSIWYVLLCSNEVLLEHLARDARPIILTIKHKHKTIKNNN